MKKVLTIVLALTMVLVFAAPVSAAVTDLDLIADGGDTAFAAGDVDISNTADTITVVYTVDAPWLILETHVDAAADAAGLEQTRSGNPRPGKFEWNEDYDPAQDTATATVAVPEGKVAGDIVYIAIHGAIVDYGVLPDDPTDDVYETVWADGTGFTGRNWAMYVAYTLD